MPYQLLLDLGLNLPVEVKKFNKLGIYVFQTGLGRPNVEVDPCMGIDLDENKARFKASMETLERYFLRMINKGLDNYFENLKHNNFSEVISLKAPYSDWQKKTFPEIALADKIKDCSPVSALDLLNKNQKVLLPKYSLFSQSPAPFLEYTSNGWAIGDDSKVLDRALLELIERDAVLYCWWTMTTPLKIVASEQSSKICLVFSDWCKQRNAQFDLLLFKSDSGAYVVGATFKGPGKNLPYFILGLGAALNATEATEKAVLELMGLLSLPLKPGLSKKFLYPFSFDDNIFSLTHHIMTYALWPKSNGYDFLFKNNVEVGLNDLVDTSIDRILENLKSKGHDLYLFEAKNKVLSDSNLRLLKVFSSSLLPLTVLHRRRPMEHPRLKNQFKNLFPHPIG